MAPKERMSAPRRIQRTSSLPGAKAASIICLLAGLWFFVSPWVYGATAVSNAWNSWAIGAVTFIVANIRVARPGSYPGLSWFNALLGAWSFFSPWIYGYTGDEGRFVNSIAVGIIVFVFAIGSGMATARTSRAVMHSM